MLCTHKNLSEYLTVGASVIFSLLLMTAWANTSYFPAELISSFCTITYQCKDSKTLEASYCSSDGVTHQSLTTCPQDCNDGRCTSADGNLPEVRGTKEFYKPGESVHFDAAAKHKNGSEIRASEGWYMVYQVFKPSGDGGTAAPVDMEKRATENNGLWSINLSLPYDPAAYELNVVLICDAAYGCKSSPFHYTTTVKIDVRENKAPLILVPASSASSSSAGLLPPSTIPPSAAVVSSSSSAIANNPAPVLSAHQDAVVPVSYFPDIDASSLEGQAANALFDRGIIAGFPDGTFGGDQAVNRAQAAKFLLLSISAVVSGGAGGSRFTDVRDGEWFTPFVVGASDRGIISGYPNGSFGPADGVNTAQFLKMATNAFNLQYNSPYSYDDVPQDAWFATFAGIAEQYALFPDRPSRQLIPEKVLSRREVAIAIHRLLQANGR